MKKVELNLVAIKKSTINRQIAEDEIFFEGRYIWRIILFKQIDI